MRLPTVNVLVVLALAAAGVTVTGSAARADQATVAVDALRTAWADDQPALSPSLVDSGSFGSVLDAPVNGPVWAPVVVHENVVIAATATNNVYGINATTGAQIWSRNFGPGWPAAAIGCSDLVPTIGVTSSPVVDPATDTVYLTAKSYDNGDPDDATYKMYALSVATGATKPGWPVAFGGVADEDPLASFNPFTQLQRPGLLLMDGVVYAGFGAHCNLRSSQGWVIGISTAGASITTRWTTMPGDRSVNPVSGVWQSGGGLVSDGPGRILLVTGNGEPPRPGPGGAGSSRLGQSVVQLEVQPNGTLHAVDFFAPSDADRLAQHDSDFGAGAPIGLPDAEGSAAHPHLAAAVGKDGRVFLLDRDDLGGRSQGPGGTDDVVSMAGPHEGGVWGHPAYYGGDGGWLYVASVGKLRAYRVGIGGDGQPALSLAGAATGNFGFGAGSPTVTSDGTTAGTGLVWVVHMAQGNGLDAELRAYDHKPVNGVLPLRWSTPIGTAVKFTNLAVSGGRVYLGTRDEHVRAYGLLPGHPLSARSADFGHVAVGSGRTVTVTLRASAPVTVNSVSAPAPFSAPPTGPVSLGAGGTLPVSVTFTPSASADATASLTVSTSAGTLGVPLRGTGVPAGQSLIAEPASVDFGDVVAGTLTRRAFDIVNPTASPVTVGGTSAPGSPFAFKGVPAGGAVLTPGQRVSVTVSYTPTGPVATDEDLTVSPGLVVPLTGQGLQGAGELSLEPPSIDFGTVDVGDSVIRHFNVHNTGSGPLTITKAKAPLGAFAVDLPIAEGTVLQPDEARTIAVRFSPTALAPTSGGYIITGDDDSGLQTVGFTGSGRVATGVLPGPELGSWRFNGAGRLDGSEVELTPVGTFHAGSAIWPRSLPGEGLRVEFDAVIGGGTGGEGLAVLLLDPAIERETALGAFGSGLGYGGLDGDAITLDTFSGAGEPAAPFVGVATRGTGNSLDYTDTAPAGVTLHGATVHVVMQISGGRVSLSLNGVERLDAPVTLPPTVLVGLSASTGTATDRHAVSNLVVTAPPLGVLTSSVVSGRAPVTTVLGTLVAAGTAPVLTAELEYGDGTGKGWAVDTTHVYGASGTYLPRVTVTDSVGRTTVDTETVSVRPASGRTVLPPSSGAWRRNGSAVASGSTVRLTSPVAGQRGSAWLSVPVATEGLSVSFDARLGDGSGGEGLTLALADPARVRDTALGGAGGGLGFVGLPGVAVALDTVPSGLVGVLSSSGSYLATAAVAGLRGTWHHVDATVSGGRLRVRVDGVLRLDRAVSLGRSVRVGFTGATSTRTDRQELRNVRVTARHPWNVRP